MAEFNDLGLTGPVVELRDTPSRDESLATGRHEERTLHVGRDAATGHVCIVVDGYHRFTMSDVVRHQLAQWLKAL